MPVKLKWKIYRRVVRPAWVYGTAETWATTQSQERRLELNKMRMLRWMCAVTKKDKFINVSGSVKVESVAKKIAKKRLRWYGTAVAAIPGKRWRGSTLNQTERLG